MVRPSRTIPSEIAATPARGSAATIETEDCNYPRQRDRGYRVGRCHGLPAFRGPQLNPEMKFRVVQLPFRNVSYASMSQDGSWIVFPPRMTVENSMSI